MTTTRETTRPTLPEGWRAEPIAVEARLHHFVIVAWQIYDADGHSVTTLAGEDWIDAVDRLRVSHDRAMAARAARAAGRPTFPPAPTRPTRRRSGCDHETTSNTGICYTCGRYVGADDVGQRFGWSYL